jgi:hypothetical protein
MQKFLATGFEHTAMLMDETDVVSILASEEL